MYRRSFSRKINCTEVKYTATKLHISPDKTYTAWSLPQQRDSDSDPTPNSTPLLLTIDIPMRDQD